MKEELIKRLREQSNKASTSDYVGALMREAIAAIESRPAPAVKESLTTAPGQGVNP